MTSTLVIPKSIASATVPAPTKAEILTALAARKVRLCYEEREKWSVRVKASAEEAQKALRDYLMAKRDDPAACKVEINNGYVNGESVYGCYMKSEAQFLPRDLQRKLVAHNRLANSRPIIPTLHDARKEIRASMEGLTVNRVGKMLEDQATVAALDKFLSKLEATQKPEPVGV